MKDTETVKLNHLIPGDACRGFLSQETQISSNCTFKYIILLNDLMD